MKKGAISPAGHPRLKLGLAAAELRAALGEARLLVADISDPRAAGDDDGDPEEADVGAD